MATVLIVDPSPSWPGEFDRVAAELLAVLGDIAQRVDHVGSTSVPGLAAKDIIDVQVTVADDDARVAACDRLQEHGYTVNHDGRDHVVVGESADAALWSKGFATERPGERRCNIHIRVAGRPNHRYALLFRDYLRAHEVTAQSYALFKRRAAQLLPEDPGAYADLKDPVCDLVYLPASRWAAEVGWGDG